MKSKDRCQGCLAERGLPCQKAQERIRAIQIASMKKEDSLSVTAGCPWFVNSAEYNYCFHSMLEDLDGLPMSDKEICKLLMITPSELKETFNSAISKLKSPENSALLLEIKEILSERADEDNSLYMPIEFSEQLKGESSEISEDMEGEGESGKKGKRGPKPKKKTPLHGMGLPLHHSGKKVDIHFGYSPSRHNEIAENRKRIKKQPKPDEDQ